jgi:hypothetical protein
VNRDKVRRERLKNRETRYERHKPRAPEIRTREGRQGREMKNPRMYVYLYKLFGKYAKKFVFVLG